MYHFTVVWRPLRYFSFPFRSQVHIKHDRFACGTFNAQKCQRNKQEGSIDLMFGHICRSNKCNMFFEITSCCRQFARKLLAWTAHQKCILKTFSRWLNKHGRYQMIVTNFPPSCSYFARKKTGTQDPLGCTKSVRLFDGNFPKDSEDPRDSKMADEVSSLG